MDKVDKFCQEEHTLSRSERVLLFVYGDGSDVKSFKFKGVGVLACIKVARASLFASNKAEEEDACCMLKPAAAVKPKVGDAGSLVSNFLLSLHCSVE